MPPCCSPVFQYKSPNYKHNAADNIICTKSPSFQHIIGINAQNLLLNAGKSIITWRLHTLLSDAESVVNGNKGHWNSIMSVLSLASFQWRSQGRAW